MNDAQSTNEGSITIAHGKIIARSDKAGATVTFTPQTTDAGTSLPLSACLICAGKRQAETLSFGLGRTLFGPIPRT